VNSGRSKSLGLRSDIIDMQVQQGRWCPGFEEQPYSAEVEERDSGRVEPGNEIEPDDVGVELHRPIDVHDILGDLAKPVHHLAARRDMTRHPVSARIAGVPPTAG
jgi:hypothetical protein